VKRFDFFQLITRGMMMLAMTGFITSCNINSEKSIEKPNIIFIMVDDLGYGHLGCYGQQKIYTPNIDHLASEGMKFTQFYSGASVCAPSRSTLMTGMHSGHTSVRSNSGGTPLLAEDITIAEVLKQPGYVTGIFGKWGLGDAGTEGVPNRQGFDDFFGYLHQVHAHYYYPYFLWENDQKFLLPGNEGNKREQYTQDVITERAMDFVRSQKDKSFFLFLPYTVPHTELLVPDDSFNEYKGEFPEPAPFVSKGKHVADQPYPRTAFAAMITRMDRDIGRIMGLLEELELDDNTIVFFTSDNGGQNGGGVDLEFFNGNGPLRGRKGQLYEGGIRVPMIAWWPGKIEPEMVSDYIWTHWDVLPTLAELAGAEISHEVDGISAAHVLLGEEKTGMQAEERKFHYWEGGRAENLRQAVRMGNWKAVRLEPGAALELYKLDDDIGEQNDLAAEYPQIVKTIEDYLESARKEPRKYKPEPPTWGYPAEETGYVR